MLTHILHNSGQLCAFVDQLDLTLRDGNDSQETGHFD